MHTRSLRTDASPIMSKLILAQVDPDGHMECVGDLICCKDCKHRDPEDKKCDSGHGIVWQLPRPDDWHCADGERKES